MVLARVRMSPLWCCPSSISSADHGVATLQDHLKDGFKEAVVAFNMPEPRKFPSLDSCQKKFLWTHKEADVAPHPVVGLALRLGDMLLKFPRAFGFESLDPFLRVSMQGPCFTAVEVDGSDKTYTA